MASVVSPAKRSPASKKSRTEEFAIHDDSIGEGASEVSTPRVPPALMEEDVPPPPAMAELSVQSLDSIAQLLDQKLRPVTSTLARVESDLKTFQQQLKTFEIRLDETAARVMALEEAKVTATEAVDTGLEERIQEMETMITKMTFAKQGGVVAIIGNLEPLGTEEQATVFMTKFMKEARIQEHVQCFIKGSKFKGMLWIRFRCHTDMLAACEFINHSRTKVGDKYVWANEDMPIEQRVCRGFLFGCRKLLVGWGYKRSIVEVDTENLSISINRQLVITAKVEGNTLHVTYHNDFTDWAEFQNNAEVGALKGKSSSSLERSAEGKKGVDKGAGKGTK